MILSSVVVAQAVDGGDPLSGLQTAANWLAQYGLWFALGAIVAGAGTLGAAQLFGGGGSGSRQLILAGAIGAICIGCAAFVVTAFSNGFAP